MSEEKKSYWQRLVDMGKQLFLIDGVGALLSATIIGGVLANYPEVVGMPRRWLLFLAGLAVVFAVYSFSCYLWAGRRWRSFLRVIAFVNMAYCLLTFVLMYADSGALRMIGACYFILEITVLLLLANIELEAAGSS